ncbi:MAG: TIGR03862 family flavoprotein [Methylobacteriaceae bacterium]|nr:TIGR03862 family flavoprotein [Methylobacteriaceae bacterium]
MAPKPRIVVIGAGPAGLMAAETAARANCAVTIFDAMPTPARKFLMAGRSGLNITHSEGFDRFLTRYGAAANWLTPMLADFSPADMRRFCASLGVETFVGSSGRVFPKAMKASPLLRAWLARLAMLGVELRTRARFVDLTPSNEAIVEIEGRRAAAPADATILALGGASWPRLGSDGNWSDLLARRGVALALFRPSNCGLAIAWSEPFRQKFEGRAVKTARFSYGSRSVAGEAVVTRRGLEGGPVYALSADIGAALSAGRAATIAIDLKPDMDESTIAARLARRRGKDSFANALRKAIGLGPLGVALLRESDQAAAARNAPDLAALVKACALPVTATAGLERAISAAGGLRREEVDDGLMLKKLPGLFAAGEMLDWDAPTGGYLLQACFATGKRAGAAAAAYATRA